MRKRSCVSALLVSSLMALTLETQVGMAASGSNTITLTYQEEGMTVKKKAYHVNSIQGYGMDVMTDFVASRQGAYDVYTEKQDPHVWFSVLKLPQNANFAKLGAAIKPHLAKIGQVNVDVSHGQWFADATNVSQHTYEAYVYENIDHQPFRFHIVHESDWESNAPFFAMFKTLQPFGQPMGSYNSSSVSYLLGYFATNHNALTFHIGKQVFYGATSGVLQVHQGDHVSFTQDNGAAKSPMPADVKRVVVTSGSSLIRATNGNAGQFSFTALRPGKVMLSFQRSHGAGNGQFTITIVNDATLQ
ncbi:MAG: hypothetical protein K6T83_05490 [Alicyclobacillus sp.]|nr:hypothetical protein [Alicyclobacillus sp.]